MQASKNKIPNSILTVGRATVAVLMFAFCGQATQLVTNGSFTATTGSVTSGQLGYNITATGWSTTGYNFLFTSAANATSGTVVGSAGDLSLDGPGNGYNNGLTASPDGGNFVGADGVYEAAPITQTISGLTALNSYVVSFYWAAAQQYNYGCLSNPSNPGGCTTDQWEVSLGSQTQYTAVANTGVNQGGFAGWFYTTMTFTATSSSELLSFMAVGTPSGEPPFALLDGVSMTATPEPGTLMLMAGTILLGLGRFARKKSVKKSGESKAPHTNEY
jgi:hypothetical protein